MTEAPRGGLAHWIVIQDGKIDNYQLVVPSTWNASPRDAKGQRSAYEASLIGTPIADPERPIEVLRTVHSFDPVSPAPCTSTTSRGGLSTRCGCSEEAAVANSSASTSGSCRCGSTTGSTPCASPCSR